MTGLSTWFTVALAAAALSCGGGGSSRPVTPPTPSTGPVSSPISPPADPDPAPQPTSTPTTEPTSEPKPDQPPEVFAPAVKALGVGQTTSFSVAAIDQDMDETAVTVTKLPASATFDAITQTVTFTPTKTDLGKAEFVLQIAQPGKGAPESRTWTIDVTAKRQPLPVAPVKSPMIEDVLMIRQPERLVAVTHDWPIDRLLLVGAQAFKWQFTDENRAKLAGDLDKAVLYKQFLKSLAETHGNARLDPDAKGFDAHAFGNPADWKIVAVRPRIDKAWTELRVVYRAVNAREPVFAMFRLRPTVEYVPALPRPTAEHDANNKIFLGMVSKHLLVAGAPNPKFVKDKAAHGRAVAALMTELMAFDDTKTAPYLRGFMVGIALEARMGGGSKLSADGAYQSGDGWAWSAMKPFQSGTTQAYQNVVIPGFWLATAPTATGSWGPVCPPKYNPADPNHTPGYEVLCRKTIGFVDLPDETGAKVKGSKIDANNRFATYKQRDMVATLALDDGRRDLGEENSMSCGQCHMRTFGMHTATDPANVSSAAGVPTVRNPPLPTLNFQITPDTHWEPFTLAFLAHQECRGKAMLESVLGPDAAKGFSCPTAK